MIIFKCLKLYLFLVLIYVCVENKLNEHNKKFFGDILPNAESITSLTLIIAHPDDEVMFFAPTLLQMDERLSPDIPLKVICLTDGDADGLGRLRKKELHNSLKILFINRKTDVFIGNFKDGMNSKWDMDQAFLYVQEKIKDNNPLLLTFDEVGVSGHINHVSCSQIVKALKYKNKMYLHSGNILLRKYSSFVIDLFYILLGYNPPIFMNTFSQYLLSLAAMCNAHASQMVWFRWGWWLTSRFVFVNELQNL